MVLRLRCNCAENGFYDPDAGPTGFDLPIPGTALGHDFLPGDTLVTIYTGEIVTVDELMASYASSNPIGYCARCGLVFGE
jgi:hypothetical protein